MVEIEVVYGMPDRQWLERLQVVEGTTVREAALQSSVADEFPEADVAHAPLGIFGKVVKDDTVLRHQDRVEIYRPLRLDPKEARRLRLANKAKS